MNYVMFALGCVAGFLIAMIFLFGRFKTLGVMYITRGEEKDTYRLDVTCPMEDLPKQKYVKIKVSQEKQTVK